MSEQNHEFSEVNTDLPFTDQEEQVSKIELSPALKNYDKIADDAEQKEDDKPNKAALNVAENVALTALGGAEWAVKKWLGANTGLSDADKEEWAEKVAPALVKMGVTDYTGFFDRYKVYIVAIVATYKLGEKITDNVIAQIAEQEAKAQAEQAPEAQQQAQPEMPSGLDAYDRDMATNERFMAGA